MSIENEDPSQGWAATLTDSVGLQDDGSGDVSDSLAVEVENHETWQAEKDIPANNDVQDEAQYQSDRAEEVEQQQGRKQKVPLAALHEERSRRQQSELQLAAVQQQLQQLQAAQQQAQQAQLQAQQEAEIPDVEEDPVGWLKAKEKQFEQRLEQLQNGGQQPQQQQAQQFEAQVMQEAAVLAPVLVDAEARFEAAHPDYRQAFDHVQAVVDAQLRTHYPSATEQQIQFAHKAALLMHVKNCQSRGVDPCQAVYASAQGLGFKPARQAPRREAPTSLSNLAGSGRAPDERGAVTASDISSMSEKEFDAFWAQMKGGGSQGPAF